MTSTLPPLVQAVAGAIGSASANTLTYPLDLVTTRVQLSSPADTSPNSNVQRSGKGKQKEQEQENSSVLNSQDVSTKRLENSTRFKAIGILHSIIQSDGVGGLYDGLLTDTASTLISNFFHFYIYSFLRKLLIRHIAGSQSSSRSPLKGLSLIKLAIWQDLALGFMSGVASRAVSMPLSIITLRLQTGRHDGSDESGIVDQEGNGNAVIQTVKKIYEEQGLSGFWRGFNTTILLSLNPSITLAFFQLFRRLLALIRQPPHSNSKTAMIMDPTPGEAFFGGAISNSIAVVLLYPLILSKTRLQASRSRSTNSESSESQSTSRPKTLGAVMLDAYYGRYHHGTGSTSSTSDKQVRRASGINGLYQGLEMQILKGFLNQGVTFLGKGR
ncbi:mitochondrial carrier domain-containing protein [Lentinula aff. lateritia]|uniref:Mitochondrial carrier domain-containing protein n=1 Tax=Lentinula aff. lateritia TaxID=2804960 RepID=A0ACC1TQ48_9AGAR|nr:mitochondrial carrier domain-containing protein [Lentinula aff. lateritia]